MNNIFTFLIAIAFGVFLAFGLCYQLLAPGWYKSSIGRMIQFQNFALWLTFLMLLWSKLVGPLPRVLWVFIMLPLVIGGIWQLRVLVQVQLRPIEGEDRLPSIYEARAVPRGGRHE